MYGSQRGPKLLDNTVNLNSMTAEFDLLSQIIRNRRTSKPMTMNGGIIPDEQVEALLQLADWAPTHGGTEPWRFFVFGGQAVAKFCTNHADMYLAHTDASVFEAGKHEQLRTMGAKASHIIIAAMKRGSLAKIPAWEEAAATAAAIQNLLLGAASLGIAAYWGSGGMVQHKVMKDYLGLGEQDIVMGAIYLGYTDLHVAGKRNTPLQDKIIWK
jgi:nitroreductase